MKAPLGWVDVHDPTDCHVNEDTFPLTDVRTERDRPPGVDLGRYKGAQCVRTCALVPAAEYDQLVPALARVRDIVTEWKRYPNAVNVPLLVAQLTAATYGVALGEHLTPDEVA